MLVVHPLPDQVTDERHNVEQRALAAGVGADEYVKAVESDVRVAEATVVERLDAVNHEDRIPEGAA